MKKWGVRQATSIADLELQLNDLEMIGAEIAHVLPGWNAAVALIVYYKEGGKDGKK